MRGGKLGRNTRKEKQENKTPGDFCLLVDPYLWKRFKNDDGDYLVSVVFVSTSYLHYFPYPIPRL